MSERDKLLDAIRTAGRDEMPRVVFADWLDEHAEGDRDRATAEFIRVSCRVEGEKFRSVMPYKAYGWLGSNWERLVPTYAATLRNLPFPDDYKPSANEVSCPDFHTERWRHSTSQSVKGRPLYYQSGRRIETYWRPRGGKRSFTVPLVFWKGFLVECLATTLRHGEAICELLRADQPLCRTPRIYGGAGERSRNIFGNSP